jgi:proteic killer suppression protein
LLRFARNDEKKSQLSLVKGWMPAREHDKGRGQDGIARVGGQPIRPLLSPCDNDRGAITFSGMIRSFANDLARLAWERLTAKGVPMDILKVAYRKLMQIQNAQTLDDLRSPPGNRLEPLKGKRKGQHSIRVNDQWRVCFRWRDGDAYDVEICDYHDE